MRFISRILKRYIIFKGDLVMEETEIPDDVSIVEVNSQNIEDVLEFRGESVLQEFRKFYTNGCQGAYAYLEGVVIGHHWREFNDTQVARLSQEGILLLPGESAGWYAYVDEKYRGKQINSCLADNTKERVKYLGARKQLAHVLQDNEASIRSNRRYGDKSETRATMLTLRLIRIYKSDDRWFVLLRLLWLRKAIVLAWSEPYKFAWLLAKL